MGVSGTYCEVCQDYYYFDKNTCTKSSLIDFINENTNSFAKKSDAEITSILDSVDSRNWGNLTALNKKVKWEGTKTEGSEETPLIFDNLFLNFQDQIVGNGIAQQQRCGTYSIYSDTSNGPLQNQASQAEDFTFIQSFSQSASCNSITYRSKLFVEEVNGGQKVGITNVDGHTPIFKVYLDKNDKQIHFKNTATDKFEEVSPKNSGWKTTCKCTVTNTSYQLLTAVQSSCNSSCQGGIGTQCEYYTGTEISTTNAAGKIVTRAKAYCATTPSDQIHIFVNAIDTEAGFWGLGYSLKSLVINNFFFQSQLFINH